MMNGPACEKKGQDVLEFKETRPGPPKAPEISDITITSLTVSWKPPEDDGRSPVTGYMLEYRETKVGRWFLAGDDLQETITKAGALKPCTSYQFRLFAKNKVGRSRASDPSEKCVTKSPTVPGRPKQPILSDVGTTFVTLTWNVPEDGGSPITGYIVEHKGTASVKWQRSEQNLVSDTSLTVRGLSWMDDFKFRVIAKNAVGKGKPSDISPEYRCAVGKWKLTEEFGHRGPDTITQADGLAIYPNKDVAVADSASGSVKIYSSEGRFKMALDTSHGLKPWQHSRPIQVKINFTGTLFVSDSTQFVKVYNEAGSYERMFVAMSPDNIPSDSHNYTRLCGLAIDNNGHVLVGVRFFGRMDAIQNISYISKHQQDGAHLESFNVSTEPGYIAVTTKDTIVISSENPECSAQILDKSGNLLHTINPTAGVVDWVPKGIACCRNTIFFANNAFRGPAGVYCYSLAGEYIGTVTEEMSSALDVVVTEDGNKIVVSQKDRVVAFERVI